MTDDQPPNRSQAPRMGPASFSIKGLLVLTAVFAAVAVSLAQFYRGVQSDGEGYQIGQFAIINAMIPTLFLTLAAIAYKLLGRFLD